MGDLVVAVTGVVIPTCQGQDGSYNELDERNTDLLPGVGCSRQSSQHTDSETSSGGLPRWSPSLDPKGSKAVPGVNSKRSRGPCDEPHPGGGRGGLPCVQLCAGHQSFYMCTPAGES